MSKLLILTYHFPPSAASGTFRLLGFAQHLPRFDWQTIVVAPPRLPWEPVDETLSARVPAETVVRHVPYPSWLPKAVRWMAPCAVWLPYARAAVRRAIADHQPDVVLTSGPPHGIHLLGRFVQRRYGLPWVADFRDPWITVEGFTGPAGLKERWELYWERQVMRHADAVVANAPLACELFQSAYPASAGKTMYLTNGYDPESFVTQRLSGAPETVATGFQPVEFERENTTGWKPVATAALRILHAGELYDGRDPRPLLDAIAGIPPGTVPPFRLEFLGRTEYEKGADLAGEARRRGVEPIVHCRGQLGYQQALREMCQADILLLMDSPGRRVGVPAKLYEYIGAGRPILAMGEEDGDLAAILRESGLPFRLVPCADPVRIRQAIVELVGGVASGQMDSLVSEKRLQFSRQALAGRLAKTLEGLREKKREVASGEEGDGCGFATIAATGKN